MPSRGWSKNTSTPAPIWTKPLPRNASRLRVSWQRHADTVMRAGARLVGGAAWVARVYQGALGLSRGRRQWATPSVLRRLQAFLILRACPSGQTLVPSGGALGRRGQHDGVWAPERTRGVGGVGGTPCALLMGVRRRA